MRLQAEGSALTGAWFLDQDDCPLCPCRGHHLDIFVPGADPGARAPAQRQSWNVPQPPPPTAQRAPRSGRAGTGGILCRRAGANSPADGAAARAVPAARVWDALRDIPFGGLDSYGALSTRCAQAAAARGGTGRRPQSHFDLHPLPSHHRQRQRIDRLRRRPASPSRPCWRWKDTPTPPHRRAPNGWSRIPGKALSGSHARRVTGAVPIAGSPTRANRRCTAARVCPMGTPRPDYCCRRLPTGPPACITSQVPPTGSTRPEHRSFTFPVRRRGRDRDQRVAMVGRMPGACSSRSARPTSPRCGRRTGPTRTRYNWPACSTVAGGKPAAVSGPFTRAASECALADRLNAPSCR